MLKALLFDVFGTIVDWRTGIAREVKTHFDRNDIAVDELAFADAWRAQYQPRMEKIRAGNRPYVALDILHRENLDACLADFDLDDKIGPDARIELNRAWEKLPPWPDSVSGLVALKSNYIIAPCSNGSIALMSRLAKYGGLPWDAILGADIAQDYKPQAAVYLASVEALGLTPAEVMMVAAHNDDLFAAREAGLKTGFALRLTEHGPGQTSDLEPSSDWDAIASDIDVLVHKLES